jgi:hypothetical protein
LYYTCSISLVSKFSPKKSLMLLMALLTPVRAMQKQPQSGFLKAIAPFVMGSSDAGSTNFYGFSAYSHLGSFDVDGNIIRLWLEPGFLQLKSGRIGST